MTTSATALCALGIATQAANKLGLTIATLAGGGTAQAGAKSITVNCALLTTSGGATAFVFPTTWEIGDEVNLFNTSATAALVYPQSGAAINGGSTDASVSIPQNQGCTFIKVSATSWRGILTSSSTPSFTTLTVSGAATVGSLASAAGILSTGPTGAGIGYATGAGGAVTQATDRTTGVTLSTLSGAITTNNASLAAEAAAEFTVTNTTVAATDVVVVSQKSGANGGNTDVYVSTTAAGSFKIKVANNNAAGGTAETGAIIINFAVIRAVAA